MSLDRNQFEYVQIAGNMKSGTSLLSSLLDDHPDIACYPGQTSATGYLYPILSDPTLSMATKWDAVREERFMKEAGGYIPVEDCNFFEVEARFKTLTQEGDNRFLDIHFALLRAFYDVFNPERLRSARIWLDKSPLSHLFADEIFEALPSTKYIHILRDPKDNFASVGGSFLKRVRSKVKREALLWRYRIWSAQSFYFAKRNLEKFGQDRYLVIRFRDLCLEPERLMAEIADFMDIHVVSSLFQPTRAGYFYPGNNKDGSVFTGISAENVSRWKERIPPYFAQVMESQPSEYLEEFDYQQYFSESERASAFRAHRLFTALIPRSAKYIKFQRRHFQSPADGIPGV
jgi:hypothetical protein